MPFPRTRLDGRHRLHPGVGQIHPAQADGRRRPDQRHGVEAGGGDPDLMGDAGPVPPEGTLLPETYLFTRGDDARRHLLARMAAAQTEIPGPAMGRARRRPAVQVAARGDDPGLHRGKGIRACRKSAAMSPSVFLNRLKIGHEAPVRSHHHLWHHQGLSAGPAASARARSTPPRPTTPM